MREQGLQGSKQRLTRHGARVARLRGPAGIRVDSALQGDRATVADDAVHEIPPPPPLASPRARLRAAPGRSDGRPHRVVRGTSPPRVRAGPRPRPTGRSPGPADRRRPRRLGHRGQRLRLRRLRRPVRRPGPGVGGWSRARRQPRGRRPDQHRAARRPQGPGPDAAAGGHGRRGARDHRRQRPRAAAGRPTRPPAARRPARSPPSRPSPATSPGSSRRSRRCAADTPPASW